MVGPIGPIDERPMKRVAAAILWAFALWNLGVMLEYVFGIPALVGLAAGIGAGLLVAIDPWHVFWSPRPARVDGGNLPTADRSAASAASELG